MPVKTSQPEKDQIYFCTFACFNWLPLIDAADAYQKVYDCFRYLEQKGSRILGYVVMPNHIHLLIYLHLEAKSLNLTIGEMKRFLAYEIVKKLEEGKQERLLSILEETINSNQGSKGKKHNVFQESFDWKLCESEKFILQKLDYMHRNPVSGKWNLVADFTEYIHSSAKFYELNEEGIYPVTHYKDITG